MRFLTWLVTTAIALAVAAWVVGGIRFIGPASSPDEVERKILPLVLVALILGLVTAVLKPVLTLVTFPFIILTLGLFLVVINALLLMLTGWLAEQLDIGFRVDGFWPAVAGAVIITVVTWAVDGIVGRERR